MIAMVWHFFPLLTAAQSIFASSGINLLSSGFSNLSRIKADFELTSQREDFQKHLEEQRQNFEMQRVEYQLIQQMHMQKDQQLFLSQQAEENFLRSLKLANLNAAHAERLQNIRLEWEDLWRKNKEKFELALAKAREEHEIKLQQYNRETALMIAQFNLQATLTLEKYKEMREAYPLQTSPQVLLEFYRRKYIGQQKIVPPMIVISPPALEFERFPHAAQGFSRLESTLNDELARFLQQGYPPDSLERPAKYLGFDWKSKSFRGQVAMGSLHATFFAIPTIILESKVDGDMFKLYVGWWNMLEEDFNYKPVITIPWKEIVYNIARKYAREWEHDRVSLINAQKPLQDIARRGGDDEKNFLILEEEEEDQRIRRKSKHDYRYNVNEDKYMKELAEFWGICHCLFAAIALDQYHLSTRWIRPKLPELLPDLLAIIPLQSAKDQLVKYVVFEYQGIYQNLYKALANDQVKEQHFLIPMFALDLAYSLSFLPEKSYAVQQIQHSLAIWLKLHHCDDVKQVHDFFIMQDILQASDETYIEKLEDCVIAVGKNQIPDADNLLDTWYRLILSGQINPRSKTGDRLFSL
jgi:hypothetical protein